MKLSKYNILKKYGEKFYLINILNSSFIEISKQTYEKLESSNNVLPEELDTKTYHELFKKGMIINDDFDELEFLKNRYIKDQQEKDLLTITIAPTLRCNFECPYCYEDRYGKIINEDEQIEIIKFIRKQLSLGYKKLNLIWFGGEPLLVFNIIQKMSQEIIEICNNLNVDYNAFLTTNGYLLSENIIKQLPNLKINQLFITLDGPEHIHNQRRCLIGGSATFDQIVANSLIAKKYGIDPVIRMNVDKTNYTYIEELRNYVTNELKLGMYLGLVREYTDSCNNENDSYFNKEEYAYLLDEFDNNMSQDKDIPYPFPKQKPIYCRAAKVGTFVIDPNLNLFKCENDIGRTEKRIATVYDYPFDNEITGVLNDSFYTWNPFEYDECCQCEILPICMGGCPFISIKQNKPECETYKYNLDNCIKKHILKRKV